MCTVWSHTEIFIAVLYNVMPRHQLAIASNISNTIHCMHKSNVKLHELDVYSQHIYGSYILTCTYVSLSTFSLVS